MPALREIERSFVDAVRWSDATTLAAHVAPLALSAERRIQIYRNHFTISLTEALSATYPTLKALVGEAFFDQTARRFAAEQPPSSPVLFEYGAAFPTFMAEATHSPEYRYLSDVGAFEWAINHAYHADDAPPFDPSTLLTVPEAQIGRAHV